MHHSNRRKGFTLAELLIVVAIIAVLVALAIPVFTTQLEKARDSVSISNIRAAYAEASTAMITWNGKNTDDGGPTPHIFFRGVDLDPDGNKLVGIEVDHVALKGTADGFSGLEAELPFEYSLMTGNGAPAGGIPGEDYVFTFKFNTATGECTLTRILNWGNGAGKDEDYES